MQNNGAKICFSPQHPVIWFAEYNQNIKELKIPKCTSCNSLIKVKDYNNIVCEHCRCDEITWSIDDGAVFIPLNNGFLLEFDDQGNETINYKYLPIDGLIKFGLCKVEKRKERMRKRRSYVWVR